MRNLRNDSLLVALSSYRPRKNRRSIEDFITEAFCWILRNDMRTQQTLLNQLSSVLTEAGSNETSFVDEEGLRWATQERLRDSRPDMLLETEEIVFVFEHKVWAEASAAQLWRHREGAEAQYPQKVYVVLVTAAQWHANEEADICLTWSSLFKSLEQTTEEDDQSIILSEFLTLLDSEGLSPTEHISESGIRAYRPAQQFQSRLRQLLKQIPHSRDEWSFVYEQLPTSDQSREPDFNRNQRGFPLEGRLGYNFRDWTPNVFVGVMLDGDDHRHELSDLGPDVVAVLDLSSKKKIGRLSRDQFLRSDKYRKLSNHLKTETESSDWSVRDNYHDEGPAGCNKWHPLILHRPLLSVLRGTQTVEEQRKCLHEAMVSGARLMLADGTLASLLTGD